MGEDERLTFTDIAKIVIIALACYLYLFLCCI